MKFDSIHGVDWVFKSPTGEYKSFSYSGYCGNQKHEAELFQQANPDWELDVQRF